VSLSDSNLSRRNFLIGSGVAGAAVVVAACGKDDKKTSAAGSTTDTTAAAGATGSTMADSGASGDLAVAQKAAGLEVLAVGTYKAALDAATANKLGAVPPAVAEFVKTAMSHHQSALDAWNDVLKKAGKSEVTAPDATLKPTVDAAFAKVTDVGGAAKLALMLEGIASATYLKVIPTLKDKGAIALAASIQPIDKQHEAVLHFALGEYPVPDTFAPTANAAA
jgi:hypothetical protein